MIESLIRACPLFAEGKCPQQKQIEKLFLFPQLSTVEDIEKICRSQCCNSESLPSDHAEKVLARLREA
jgi:hypothetical protein